jgi:hypothetical protein
MTDTEKDKQIAPTTETSSVTEMSSVTETLSEADAISAYLAEADPQMIVGQLLKHVKGEFQKGRECEVVPEGTMFAVACDLILSGFILWKDGKPARHALTRIASGKPVPRRSDLGENDKTQWPTDKEGKAQDPWQPVMYAIMMDTDCEFCTFTTGSKSGISSLHRLLRRHATHVVRHPGDYPLVKLKVDSFMHKDRSIGKVRFPDFEPAGYVDRAEFCEALEALGVAVNQPEPKALPKPTTTAEDMRDEIPF